MAAPRDEEASPLPFGRAEAIKKRRVQKEWTQQELADHAGITRRTVSRGEKGYPMSPKSVLALEKTLEMTMPGPRPAHTPTMPRTAAVGAFMRQIRKQTKSVDVDAPPGRKWETLENAARSLLISSAQLSRLERGTAAPNNLFSVGRPDGDIHEMNKSKWNSVIYKPFHDQISDLATGDGSRRGAFRRDAY
jgi:DNA-binding XRE family transcriptional regulator